MLDIKAAKMIFLSNFLIWSIVGMSSIQGRLLPGEASFDPRKSSNSFYSEKWTSTGEVPGKLAQVPPAPLHLVFNRNKRVFPNDTVTTDDMLARPLMKWESEEGALYTIVLIDFGIKRLEGQQYFHWLVANMPGGWYSVNRGKGDEVRKFSAIRYSILIT